ncbi:hypothetical protein RYA05_03290 [Pseudomonas syringae pv. actinidiae]|nr:hypothetical protein [Pseudomonas syringae pv. actinidiae]
MNVYQIITSKPERNLNLTKFNIVIERHFVMAESLNMAWALFTAQLQANIPFESFAVKVESPWVLGPEQKMRISMDSTKYPAWLEQYIGQMPSVKTLRKGPEEFDEWFWRQVTARKFEAAGEDESVYLRPSIHHFLDMVEQIPATKMGSVTLEKLYQSHGTLQQTDVGTLEYDVRRTLAMVFEEHMELDSDDHMHLSLEAMRYKMMELLRSKPNRVYEEQMPD